MSGHRVKDIDEMTSLYHGVMKLAGDELGVESFGLQIMDVPAGFDRYPEHDHSSDGQEEVYLVLHGRAEFEVDGETVELIPGRMLCVRAGTSRQLRPPAEAVRILALGGVPGRAYTRPDAFRLEAAR